MGKLCFLTLGKKINLNTGFTGLRFVSIKNYLTDIIIRILNFNILKILFLKR
jgi:hypothetical protein